MSRTTLANISFNLKKMQEIQEKLSTGKRINRPSDDPSGARKVLGLKAEELKFQQFSENAEVAKERMNYTFNSLENIQEILTKIKELGIQGSNDEIGQSERKVISNEMNELLESVLQYSNTDNGGRFIFAGTKTSTIPFSATRDSFGKISSVTYDGNQEENCLSNRSKNLCTNQYAWWNYLSGYWSIFNLGIHEKRTCIGHL